MQLAALVLEDGKIFYGNHFGYKNSQGIGEVVFHTSMSGYQEVITDPSYKSQIVCFTYPSIGNYGINLQDNESDKPYLSGIIVKEHCLFPSNHSSMTTLSDYLKQNKIMGISNVDTRAIVLHIREKGALQGGIFMFDSKENRKNFEKISLEKVKQSPKIYENNLTTEFDGKYANEYCKQYLKKQLPQKDIDKQPNILILDFGIKLSIVDCLLKEGLNPTVVSGNIPYQDWEGINLNNYQGFFISNGPGDPSKVTQGILNIQYLLSLGKPIFGICLGHQMICEALEMSTYKMKFGHHGANQPVTSSNKKNIWITSQNHSFAVDNSSLDKVLEGDYTLEKNLNDDSIEGFWVHKNGGADILSIQYHPEASPGPQDARELFKIFANKISQFV